MNIILLKYIKEFWSPEKVILIFSTILFFFIEKFQSAFYQSFCFTGEGIRNSPCHGFVLDYVYTPLATTSIEFIFFFLLLLLLPLSLLHTWFKYIASWSVPLGLLIFATTRMPEVGGSRITLIITPAEMLLYMVQLWIVLLIGYVLVIAGKQIWRRRLLGK